MTTHLPTANSTSKSNCPVEPTRGPMRYLCWRCSVFVLTTCMMHAFVVGQQPPSTPPTTPTTPSAQSTTPATTPATSNELVEGLLDLLNEPTPKKQNDPKKQPLTPADVGLDGEDLGEPSENPLLAVRQSMLIAAGYLRRDGANADTMKLQSDIVRRLDDLISELEKSQGKQDKSEQDAKQQAMSQAEQKQRAEQNRAQAMKSRNGEQKNPESGEDRADRQGEPENPPSQRSRGGSAVVELADPKSLQQDVWGQLPARVRQQMQSRMVEQFLPAYKEQIEAYFQALLK